MNPVELLADLKTTLKTRMKRRREALVARASVGMLDALEAVERLERRLAAAPERLRQWRRRAPQAPKPEAPRVGITVEARAPRQAPLPPPPPQLQGRKVAPAQTSARNAKGPLPRRKTGFVVKRGQKHHPH